MTSSAGSAHLPDAYALAIGVSRYQHIPPLPHVLDAPDVAATLTDPAFAGYSPANVRVLLNAEATRAAILAELEWLAQRTTRGSTVVLYFSGHGGRIERDGREIYYLLPVDAEPGDALERTAISGDELSAWLRALPAARVTVLLDCCRASGIAEPKDVEALAPGLTHLTPSALAPLAQRRGRVVIAASGSDGFAYVAPGQRNGVFTRHLLDGLRGAAKGTGGVILIFDLYDYVQQRVVSDVHGQQPVFKCSLEENYPIALYRGGTTLPPGIGLPMAARYEAEQCALCKSANHPGAVVCRYCGAVKKWQLSGGQTSLLHVIWILAIGIAVGGGAAGYTVAIPLGVLIVIGSLVLVRPSWYWVK